MNRISTNHSNDNMMYHLRNRQDKMSTLNDQMASQKRIQDLRDDPVAAAHATRYQSYLNRLDRFAENIQYTQDNLNLAETYLKEGTDILQRIREIAVQGAQGTYSNDDMRAMAVEVDQLMRELIEIANGRTGEGTMIFSGERSKQLPFRVIEGNVEGADGLMITNVEYIGNPGSRMTEISEGNFINTNVPGNRAFWAENHQIYSTTDSQNYRVLEDQSIYIDGEEIKLTAGDTLYGIVEKINNSDAAVKAKVDPVYNSLVIQSTAPHQVWLQDSPDGTVLKDLGVLSNTPMSAPNNLAPTSREIGGSVFDMVMRLRDQLFSGSPKDVGGSGLRGIDTALSNVLGILGEIGAQGTRLNLAYQRNQSEIPDITQMYSREVDIDITEAIMNLKMMEYTHKAALSTAAKIVQPTLLDFLR